MCGKVIGASSIELIPGQGGTAILKGGDDLSGRWADMLPMPKACELVSVNVLEFVCGVIDVYLRVRANLNLKLCDSKYAIQACAGLVIPIPSTLIQKRAFGKADKYSFVCYKA